jgi:deoxyxylulose-5-phosphate synthase
MASVALEAFAMLDEEGIKTAVFLCEFIKPYEMLAGLVSEIMPEYVRNIVFLEEEIKSGGFGMNLSAEIKKQRIAPRAAHRIIAVDDNFAVPQKGETVWQAAGVDSHAVYEAVLEMNGIYL